MALSNTTADPFGGSANGGATPVSGTCTVTLYPTLASGGAGTSGAFTTSSTKKPGIGLSSDGSLAPGAMWRVNVSELAAAAGVTMDAGYVFIQCGFLNGHGQAFVYGPNFVSGANMVTLPNPSNSPRSGEVGLGH